MKCYIIADSNGYDGTYFYSPGDVTTAHGEPIFSYPTLTAARCRVRSSRDIVLVGEGVAEAPGSRLLRSFQTQRAVPPPTTPAPRFKAYGGKYAKYTDWWVDGLLAVKGRCPFYGKRFELDSLMLRSLESCLSKTEMVSCNRLGHIAPQHLAWLRDQFPAGKYFISETDVLGFLKLDGETVAVFTYYA